jgi:DNA-directed RNA polymerase delta subunit
MFDLVRTQVLLDTTQREQLHQIAKETGRSFSEMVREFLAAQLRLRTYEEVRQATQLLYQDYAHDGELVALTALDGEDFLNV